MCLETIFKRRSVRKYTDQMIQEEDLIELLRAAMAAPSAGNQQPWHFVLIKDPSTLVRIPDIHPHAQMVPGAQAAILICGDEALERHKGFWMQDCAAAVQNMLLAITAKGLGGVWVGIYPREERVAAFRKMFGIPQHIIPFALVPIGYPAEIREAENRFKAERIHYEQW